MNRIPLMAIASTLAFQSRLGVAETRDVCTLKKELRNVDMFLPRAPHRTPKISGRPPIGWRTAQRKRTYAKLAKRQRVNRGAVK